MRSTRRQRHKLLLLLANAPIAPIAILLIILLQQQVATHQVEALNSIGAYQYAPNTQAASSSSSSSKQYHPQHNHNHHHQHHHHQSQLQQPSRASNVLLVSGQSASLANHHQQQTAQSLPLTRQLADLDDNVIESTTLISSTSSSSSSSSSADNLLTHQKSAVTTQALTSSTCQLPPTWAGKWYQSNKEPIRVTNTEISDKGVCRDQKGDKYLFEFSGGLAKQSSPPCLVCLVINERHLNVLQYKESSCQPLPVNYFNRSSTNGNSNSLQQVNSLTENSHSLLESICSDITGDAQLESLFRLETPPIECPINGQFSFTYDACREPQSSLNSCIDKKQLNFKFNACSDVPGSESKCFFSRQRYSNKESAEVLKCYADWSEGNNYYMIGQLEHASNNQDKGKFRCYVYEKSADGKIIQMAQSLEESCYGMINPNEGPKTLRLTVKPPTYQKCFFPSYIQSQSENWLSVDSSLIYMFNQNSTKYQVKETKEGNIIEEATCLQQFTSPVQVANSNPSPHHQHLYQARSSSNSQPQVVSNRRYPPPTGSNYQADQSPFQQQASPPRSAMNDFVYLIQIIKNCHTTNYCVRFYKRSNGIVQIDYFNSQPNSDNPCRSAFIDQPQTQIITSTNLEHQRCPFEGAYTIEAPIESDLTYNPSNIFICPRQSFLTAQCDHPNRLRIHSKCSPAKFFIKNLYCLGSWTTNGLVRLLLADDDRQRYSAWYRDYGTLQLAQDGASSASISQLDLAQAQALQARHPVSRPTTRSQQMLMATTAASNNQPSVSSLAPIVDLQIALLTPLPIVAKPMQVRLTRRHQCSELRGYTSQGAAYGGSMSSSSIPSYASSATASSAATPLLLNIKLAAISYYSPSSMLIMIVTLLMPLRRHLN